jgi:hypothetical protein
MVELGTLTSTFWGAMVQARTTRVKKAKQAQRILSDDILTSCGGFICADDSISPQSRQK